MLTTWVSKPVAGAAFPAITVKAVQLTRQNIDGVAALCAGKPTRRGLLVPSLKVVGDPNTHVRSLKRVECTLQAELMNYVVLYDGFYHVVSARAFEGAYNLA